MRKLHVYQNEAESLVFDGITVENRLDSVSVYGTLDFTADRIGLSRAKKLSEILDSIINELESRADLPEKISILRTTLAPNPFLE